ncbi:hypothetical protein OQA88_11972 [Cercophora sp. LCS_1]
MAELQSFLRDSTSKSPLFLAIALGLAITYQALVVAYNLFFHPLRKFPGPILQRASYIPWAVRHVKGRQALETHKLHEKYGPVVRITPNHLSFTDAQAFKDIYGHMTGNKSGHAEMSKTIPFNRPFDDVPDSIVNASRDKHAHIRRALSHSFSDSSMRQQENIMVKHIDLLLQKLHEKCAEGRTTLNIEEWYNWTTFDITGDLVFGESFACLEGTAYHPWVEFIFGAVRFNAYITAMDYLGFHWLVQLIFRFSNNSFKDLQNENVKMLEKRLAMKEPRQDLFEGLAKRSDNLNISFGELTSNAFILTIAGSETTATTLAGATYLLTMNPHILEKLNKEVRSMFNSSEEINITSVNKLSYLLAVLNESLRMYPPVTSNLVRQVPPGGSTVAGNHVAGGTFVEVQQWSANHSSRNWVNPWEFNPDRFLHRAEKGNDGNVLESLQPFSIGPRNCIGRNLAYAEMRLILARIIYDFDLRIADNSTNWIDAQKTYTLWDRVPLNVYLTPVNRG